MSPGAKNDSRLQQGRARTRRKRARHRIHARGRHPSGSRRRPSFALHDLFWHWIPGRPSQFVGDSSSGVAVRKFENISEASRFRFQARGSRAVADSRANAGSVLRSPALHPATRRRPRNPYPPLPARLLAHPRPRSGLHLMRRYTRLLAASREARSPPPPSACSRR